MQTKHYVWIALAVGLGIGILGWVVFGPSAATPAATSTPSTTGSSTVVDLGGGNYITLPPGAVIEPIDNASPAVPPPSLTRPITITATLSAEAAARVRANIEALVAELKTAPTRVDLWLRLGTNRKIAGDYQGAIEAWTYVAKTAPNSVSSVAYGNLGDLYLNFIHDYEKAEANFKAALALKPGYADYESGLTAAQEAQ